VEINGDLENALLKAILNGALVGLAYIVSQGNIHAKNQEGSRENRGIGRANNRSANRKILVAFVELCKRVLMLF